MDSFPLSEKTKMARLAKRGHYDKETIYSILDEALFCTISYAHAGQSFQIPTGFCRLNDQLYIHGSVGSHYLRLIVEHDLPLCVSATLIDGIVLARSAFHHSVNYRSVVLFGSARVVTDEIELSTVLEVFTEKMCPGRWADIRKPTKKEWKATMVLSIRIDDASAKIRTGGPKDDDEDYALKTWAGVLPVALSKGTPVRDDLLSEDILLPSYLEND